MNKASDFRHRLRTKLLLAYSVLSFVVMSHASFAWGSVAGRAESGNTVSIAGWQLDNLEDVRLNPLAGLKGNAGLQTLAHMGLGAATARLTGQDPAAGLTAQLMGQDQAGVATAANVARNAAENNFLNHLQSLELAEKPDGCDGNTDCIQKRFDDARDLANSQNKFTEVEQALYDQAQDSLTNELLANCLTESCKLDMQFQMEFIGLQCGSIACLKERAYQMSIAQNMMQNQWGQLIWLAITDTLPFLGTASFGKGAGAVDDIAKATIANAVKGGTGVAGEAVNTGKLIGSIDNLTAAEQSFVKEMVAGGKTVEIIPAATGRTADFFIDGTRYELKTMSNVVNQTSDGLSKALSSTIMDARGQSGNIIIDARNQAGMTAEIAERGAVRAFGRDAQAPGGPKIQSISIITPQGTYYVPRLPQ